MVEEGISLETLKKEFGGKEGEFARKKEQFQILYKNKSIIWKGGVTQDFIKFIRGEKVYNYGKKKISININLGTEENKEKLIKIAEKNNIKSFSKFVRQGTSIYAIILPYINKINPEADFEEQCKILRETLQSNLFSNKELSKKLKEIIQPIRLDADIGEDGLSKNTAKIKLAIEQIKNNLGSEGITLKNLGIILESADFLQEKTKNCFNLIRDHERIIEEQIITALEGKLGNDSVELLYVDDEEIARGSIERFGKNEGIVVKTAKSSYEAKHLLMEITPQVMLIDIQMPGEDGISFVKRLSNFPRLKNIPKFFITATELEEKNIPQILKETGAIDVFPKPIESRHFKKIMSHIKK